MSVYQTYEEFLNRSIFAETNGVIEIKTKSELLEISKSVQLVIREIFQTGTKAVDNGSQVYYFPIFCHLKVEAILLLFPKVNEDKEFASSIHFLQKTAELSCKWVGESIENKKVNRENELTKIENRKLFSTVTEPLCLISRDGVIQEINAPLASMIQKGSSSLLGERVTELFTQESWKLIQKQMKKGEISLKVKHYKDEFLGIIQPITWRKEIQSYLILMKTKKEQDSQRKPRELFKFTEIKGKSASLEMAINAAKRVAKGDATVMLRGESGTGKEMFAQSIHQTSNRKDQPFIAINCAAIPENLLESELFGYEKSAFTGADKSKPGRFELANKGTLFLDEIGDMPLYLQAKILRVIQERSIERIGSNQSINIDVRLITATHQNLEHLVREGKFREDLYYRISVIPIHIPPLRDRKEDLPILIEHYMREFSNSMKRPTKRLSEQVVHRLLDYHWPGNIRELQNLIRRFVELEIDDTISLDSLPVFIIQSDGQSENGSIENGKFMQATSKRDKDEIIRLLDIYGRDTEGKKKVATHLGISLATLYRKLKKLKLS